MVSGYTGAVLRPSFASADFLRSIGNDSDDETPIDEMFQGGGQL